MFHNKTVATINKMKASRNKLLERKAQSVRYPFESK